MLLGWKECDRGGDNQTEAEVQDSGDRAETVQRCQVGESASTGTVVETEEENQTEAEV